MTELEAADLVLIAGRTLGVGADDALARMDIAAAQAALAEARSAGRQPGAAFPDSAAAAEAGVALLRALLRHRPFPQQNKQVAVAAGLQFLALNGWQADLDPAPTAAVVIEALASGRLATGVAAAWLSPRLSAIHSSDRVGSPRATAPGLRPALPRLLPADRAPVGRAAMAALLAVTVGSVVVLAACSHAPGMSADTPARAPASHSSVRAPARPAGTAVPGVP